MVNSKRQAESRRYFEKHKEEIRKRNMEYYRANREQKIIQMRIRYKAHREDNITKARQYREANKEQIKERRKQRYKGKVFNFKRTLIQTTECPRIGVCNFCRAVAGIDCRRTELHHEQYDETNPLAHTIELCSRCHRLRTWDLGQIRGGRHHTMKTQISSSMTTRICLPLNFSAFSL